LVESSLLSFGREATAEELYGELFDKINHRFAPWFTEFDDFRATLVQIAKLLPATISTKSVGDRTLYYLLGPIQRGMVASATMLNPSANMAFKY
jgi:hypothetical protein